VRWGGPGDGQRVSFVYKECCCLLYPLFYVTLHLSKTFALPFCDIEDEMALLYVQDMNSYNTALGLNSALYQLSFYLMD
jgi:hypothetical protein